MNSLDIYKISQRQKIHLLALLSSKNNRINQQFLVKHKQKIFIDFVYCP